MDDDICGLDDRRLNIHEKMQHIYKKTCLKQQFSNADLEVSE